MGFGIKFTGPVSNKTHTLPSVRLWSVKNCLLMLLLNINEIAAETDTR